MIVRAQLIRNNNNNNYSSWNNKKSNYHPSNSLNKSQSEEINSPFRIATQLQY